MRVILTISTRQKWYAGKAKVTTSGTGFLPCLRFCQHLLGETTADGTLIEHFGRRCQGWFEDDDGHREQCDFRFPFKNCPQCNAENDIAARRCRECDTVLVNPDNVKSGATTEERAGITL